MTDQTKAGRRQFLLLAALFAAPLLAAIALHVWPQFQPKGRTNYGELIEPSRPLPDALKLLDADGKPADAGALRGKWSVVYLGGAECGDACQKKLFEIRQVRILLSDERVRLRRVYIAPDAAALQLAKRQLGEVHQDLVYLSEAGLPGQRAADFFHGGDAQTLYLVDPLGYWMMAYPPDRDDYKKVLKDIKYLLKLSKIG